MENLETLYARYFRPAALMLGLLAYVSFTGVLWQDGYLRTAGDAYLQLILVWGLGLALLLVIPQRITVLTETSKVLLRALWCNLGVVGLAVLVPHSVRVLLLVVPVFSVFYAALHAHRRHVFLIVAVTWLFYVVCTTLIAQYASIDFRFEFLVSVAFGLMLGGSLLLAWEALRRQDELLEKSDELGLAMARVAELAMKDELTGVHNRRYLLEMLERQQALADRGEQGFTLCYCDLDFFKRINDQFGHAVGDDALRRFAQLANEMIRTVDYVARFGGEEFVLLLVGADEREAKIVAERLASKTRAMNLVGVPTDLALSVSIGITAYRTGENIDEVLNRADRALFAAKDAGRDTVLIAQD